MKTESDWNVYRTRFLVRARQLTDPLKFTDALGREHCGQSGDYLVEIFDGLFTITPRKFFEDIYVALNSQTAGPEMNGVAARPDVIPNTGTDAADRHAEQVSPICASSRSSPANRTTALIVPSGPAGGNAQVSFIA